MTERPTRPDVRVAGPDLAVEVHDLGGTPVVALTGELDMVTVPQVRERIDAVGSPLVLDLVRVRLLSSAALQMLVDLHEDHRAGGHVLHVVVDRTRTVLRPLQITGLDAVLSLHETVPDALAGRLPTRGVGSPVAARRYPVHGPNPPSGSGVVRMTKPAGGCGGSGNSAPGPA